MTAAAFTGGPLGAVGLLVVLAAVAVLSLRWIGARPGPAWLTSTTTTAGVALAGAAVLALRFAGAL